MRITDYGFPTWLTGDEWQRVDQIRELVKQEGGARCEAAFDDLHVEIQALRAQLAAVEQGRDRNREDSMKIEQTTSDLSPPIIRPFTLYLERRDALTEAERTLIVDTMTWLNHPPYCVTPAAMDRITPRLMLGPDGLTPAPLDDPVPPR